MIKKVSFYANGQTVEIEVPANAVNIVIEMEGGVKVCAYAPQPNGDYGSVATFVNPSELFQKDFAPDVRMTVGDVDPDKGIYKWRTDAMLYMSYNGRIIGKNQTHGFASTEKPIATQPYTNLSYKEGK